MTDRTIYDIAAEAQAGPKRERYASFLAGDSTFRRGVDAAVRETLARVAAADIDCDRAALRHVEDELTGADRD